MTTFAQAINAPMSTVTTNGMAALTDTGNCLTDLFFNVGSARNNQLGISAAFAKAFGADPILATKIMFWARDVRQGAGERETFRTLLTQLEVISPNTVIKNIRLIPEFGRWDDLFVLRTNACRAAAFELIAETLTKQPSGYQLCAKWTPRKGQVAVQLRNHMKLSPKAYRKLLVHSTNVVETAMCDGNWSKINYEHVPSIAAKQYANAFGRHDPQGYSAYKDKLVSGEAKINAGAIFPHDIVHSVRRGDSTIAQAQWNALPNYLGDNYILPVVDVSGSMDCPLGKGSTVTCLSAAVALGLYIANKQQGAFHNIFCTFSESPELQQLTGESLVGHISQMSHSKWGMNTNIEAVFDLILMRARSYSVDNSEMPKVILIMSDMQFDQCAREPNDRAIDMIRNRYKSAGYEMPKVVFWNMNSVYGNAPVAFKESGTALISGFSPAIMKSVLAAENITPWDVMMTTIGSDRYSGIQV